MVLVPQETKGERRNCGLLEDKEQGGNSLVPIPQEPTGGGGGVVRRRKGGLDGERNTPSSLSSTVGMARKGRGRKQSDKGKEVSGRKLEMMH